MGVSISALGPDTPALRLEGQAGVVTVGRDPGCDLVLTDELVSGMHAAVSKAGKEVHITDRGSSNGTRVRDLVLPRGIPVRIGPEDVVTLGATELSFFVRAGAIHVGRPQAAGVRSSPATVIAAGGASLGRVAPPAESERPQAILAPQGPGVAPPPPIDVWNQRVFDVGVGPLVAHLRAYQQTRSAAGSLPFLEPTTLVGFADRALEAISAAGIDIAATSYESVPSRLRAADDDLRRLDPLRQGGSRIGSNLASHFVAYRAHVASLGLLRDEFARYSAAADERSQVRAVAVGGVARAAGSLLGLGTLVASLAGEAAGYVASKMVDDELEEKWSAVESALQSTTEAWDEGFAAAAATTYHQLCDYHSRLAAALEVALQREAEARERAAERARIDSGSAGGAGPHASPGSAGGGRERERSRGGLLGLLVGAVALAAWGGHYWGAFDGTRGNQTSESKAQAQNAAPQVSNAAPLPTGSAPAASSAGDRASLIVLPAGAVVRKGPAPSFPVVASVTHQEAAFVVDTSVPGWTKVRLQDGREGWLVR